MSWSARHAWSVGEILTAANHNSNDGNLDLVWHEVAYNAYSAGSVSVTATTEATATAIVTASAVTFDGAHAALIEFFAPFSIRGTSWIQFVLYDGSSSVGILDPSTGGGGSTSNDGTKHLTYRLTPSNASHTYSVRAFVDAGTGTVYGGAGGSGANAPAFIRISQQG